MWGFPQKNLKKISLPVPSGPHGHVHLFPILKSDLNLFAFRQIEEVMESEIFKWTRRFYEDLLDDNSWLQMTHTDGLWKAIEKTVSDNLNQPGMVLRDRVNSAIANLRFSGRTIRLTRNYI